MKEIKRTDEEGVDKRRRGSENGSMGKGGENQKKVNKTVKRIKYKPWGEKKNEEMRGKKQWKGN